MPAALHGLPPSQTEAQSASSGTNQRTARPQVTSKKKTVSRCCLTFGQLAYLVDAAELAKDQGSAAALMHK